jgi:hypothetical protein
MKRQKTDKSPERLVLELLKRVLPKATDDLGLAERILAAVERELQQKTRAQAFEKFCSHCAVPDFEPASIKEIQAQLAESFGDGDVTVKPNRKDGSLAVEVALTDGSQFTGSIKVNPEAAAAEEDDGEPKPKFVPFPVCLPGDPELVWVLARRENLAPDEAAMALSRIEEEFWATKAGQKLQQDRIERSFPEFVSRVPSGMLADSGLKRHYKEPEPLKQLHLGPPPKKKANRE